MPSPSRVKATGGGRDRSVGEWGGVFGDPDVATASSTGSCITATSSRPAATATGCAKSAVRLVQTCRQIAKCFDARGVSDFPAQRLMSSTGRPSVVV